MNYTGMLAEVTGGVEKLPAAKTLGLDVMLKTRHCGGLGYLERVLQLLRYYSAQFISGCWKGTSSQLSKLGPRRNSANSLHVLCRLEERLRPWRHLYCRRIGPLLLWAIRSVYNQR